MKIDFRKAEAADADAVLALYHAVSGTEFSTWNDEYPGTEEIGTDIRNGDLYLMMDGEKIAGAISIVPDNEFDDLPFWTSKDNVREIARVAVATDYQGKGLSRRLVDHVTGALQSRGCNWIHLLVAVKNIPAQRLYAGCGFRVAGRCEAYGISFYACEKEIGRTAGKKQYKEPCR